MAILDFLFGRTRPQATSSTVNTRSVLPDEVAPYIKEINEEAQRLYAERGEYKPYEGETIAPRTVEEEEAISGLRGLVGTQDPYRAESEAILRGIPREFTSEIADRFMDPYQQNVTDVIKRKAGEDFQERIMPQFERKAIREGGGPGGLGTRAGVAAAMLGENLQTQLSDIQTVGQQKAFQDAYGRFTDQSARDRTFASDIGAQGTQKFNIGLAEQGLKQTLGQADREEAQALLNRDFGDYIEEEEYDQSELAQYASFINSNPFLRTPSTERTTTGTLQPTTSTAQQLLSAGLTGLNLFGKGGGFGTAKNPDSSFSFGNLARNLFSNQGGYIRGGLDSLPIIRRQQNGRVGAGGSVLGNYPISSSATPPFSLSDVVNRRRSRQQELTGPLRGSFLKIEQAKREAQRKKQEMIEALLTSRRAADTGQSKAMSDLTERGLTGIRKGLDEPIGPAFGAAAEAVLKADPTQGFVGLLAEAGTAALKGQDAERKERAALEREIAGKELELKRSDLSKSQERESSTSAAAAESAIKDAIAKGTLDITLAGMDTKVADDALARIAAETGVEKNMLQMQASWAAAVKDGRATPDQNPAILKKQGLNDVLASFNYMIDNDGNLAFLKGTNIKESDDSRKKMLAARKKYNATFTSYLNRKKKLNKSRSITYTDAVNAATVAARVALLPAPPAQ